MPSYRSPGEEWRDRSKASASPTGRPCGLGHRYSAWHVPRSFIGPRGRAWTLRDQDCASSDHPDRNRVEVNLYRARQGAQESHARFQFVPRLCAPIRPENCRRRLLGRNAADRFYSPLRKADDITTHATSKATARQIAGNAVSIFGSIHLRTSVSDVPGMEAVGVVVVEHDNLGIHPDPSYRASSQQTRAAPVPPNLPVGDPFHYETMIQRICNAYATRFP